MQIFTAISLLYFNNKNGYCKLPTFTIILQQLLHQRCKTHFDDLLLLQRPNSILYQSFCNRRHAQLLLCPGRRQSGITTNRQKLQRLLALLPAAWSRMMERVPLQYWFGISKSGCTGLLSCADGSPHCMISSLF